MTQPLAACVIFDTFYSSVIHSFSFTDSFCSPWAGSLQLSLSPEFLSSLLKSFWILLLEFWYSGTYQKIQVRWGNVVSAPSEVSNGVRPLFYLMYIWMTCQNSWICVTQAVWLVTQSSAMLCMPMTASFLVHMVLGCSNCSGCALTTVKYMTSSVTPRGVM